MPNYFKITVYQSDMCVKAEAADSIYFLLLFIITQASHKSN